METKLSSNVADLSEEQRKLLESLIGQPLSAEEVVYWVVMRPERTPTAADKARARVGMQELLKKADRHTQEQGSDGGARMPVLRERVELIREIDAAHERS